MLFYLGFSMGSALGFLFACFCSMAARQAPESMETVSSRTIKEVAGIR